MRNLRSPDVHNLAVDPFALGKFAGKKRKNRRGKFASPYDRPMLDFFNKHCDFLINEYSLDKFHIPESIESIDISKNRVELRTHKGRHFHAKKIVLALGQSEKLTIPNWAKINTSNLVHIFSSRFEWDELIKEPKSIAIVGGGITAIQTALYAESMGMKVHLLSAHTLRKHQFDSDPGWLGPKYMGNFSSEQDYEKRRDLISVSRHTGSIPPDLFAEIKHRIYSKRIHFYETEVQKCELQGDSIHLSLQNHPELVVDKVILATGFEKIRPGGEMVDQLVHKYKLPVSSCGFPIVDRNLAWHPMVHVSGSLAELEVGPVAKNIAGARLAGDRIVL